MSWIPDEFLQIFEQNGFLGVIHKILAMLAISPDDEATVTELEETLECAIFAYEEETEAEVERRIKARKRNATDTSRSETQNGDGPPQHAPQLDSGVFGKDAEQTAEVSEPPLAIRLYPESLSESQIESICSQPLSQRRRNNKHQWLQTHKSSPNYILKDEDFSVLAQDTVNTQDNELTDVALEVNELEVTSEEKIYSGDEEALLNHDEAMPHQEFLRTGQSVPTHLSHIVEEFKSSEDLLHPGSVDQSEEQGCRTSNYPEEQQVMEIEEQEKGEISSRGSNHGLEYNSEPDSEHQLGGRATYVISHNVASETAGEQQAIEIEEQQQGEISSRSSNHGLEENSELDSEHQLGGRATYVISHNVAPETAGAMSEDTGHLPREPQPQLGYGNNDEVKILSPSSTAVSAPYQCYDGPGKDEYGYSNSIVHLEMDELVEPNSWITSHETAQGEVELTERSNVTSAPEDEDAEHALQALDRANDPVKRLPVEENKHSHQEVCQVNDPVQSTPSDMHLTDNHRETEEASMSCETSLVSFNEHAQNDEQSNSHFCTSSSEIVQPQLSTQTPTFRSRSSSQNMETSRTYVIEDSLDEGLDRPHISPCIMIRTVTPSTRPESMLVPETESVRPLYSTSPRPKEQDSSEVELGSHSDTSMTESHPVISRDDVSSSLSHTSAAFEAPLQLPDIEPEGLNHRLKSPLRTQKKRHSSAPGDSRSDSPSGTQCGTEKLPRIYSAPSCLTRPQLTQATMVPTLPPIFESVVLRGSPIPSGQEKDMAPRKTRSLPSVKTSANEYSTTPCSSQTNILPKSPTKRRMKDKRAQTANSTRSSNGLEDTATLFGRVISKPPPSPSPSKSPQRSRSLTGGRPNVRYT